MSKVKAPVIQCLVRDLFQLHKWCLLTGAGEGLIGTRELCGVSCTRVMISMYEFRGQHSIQSTVPCLEGYKRDCE